MAGKTSGLSRWKQMLAGTFSVTFRQVFVIALTVVSLAVWTVTVIGMGMLRESSGYTSTVQTAEGSSGFGDSLIPVTPPPPWLPEPDPAPSAVAPKLGATQSPAAETVAAGAPSAAAEHNPFAVSEKRFPLPNRNAKVGTLQDAVKQDDTTPGLQRDQLMPLRLDGTLILGPDPVAIVGGNSFELEGRTMLLMLKEISSKYRVGDKMITVKDTVNHFKVGDTLEVRPVTLGEDRVRIGDEAVMLKVSKITNNSVELTLGDKTYVLRMTK